MSHQTLGPQLPGVGAWMRWPIYTGYEAHVWRGLASYDVLAMARLASA